MSSKSRSKTKLVVAVALVVAVFASGCSLREVQVWFQIRGVLISSEQARDIADKVNAQRPTAECDPNYVGFCVPNNQTSVRCAGTPGVGPEIGPVWISGWDHFGLSPSGNGFACVPPPAPPAPTPAPPTPAPTPPVTTPTLPLEPQTLPGAEVSLANHSVAYDRARNRLLVSVDASVPGLGNRLIEMNPVTGAVGRSLVVPAGPGVIAISSDSSRAYIGLLGAPEVLEVNLATFGVTRRIHLSPDPVADSPPNHRLSSFAGDIAVHPTQPQTIAVARRVYTENEDPVGVAIFDNGAPRPTATGRFESPTRITWGTDPNVLYGYNGYVSSAPLYRLDVSPTGVSSTWLGEVTGVAAGVDTDIAFDNGYVRLTNGRMYDPARGTWHMAAHRGPFDVSPTNGQTFTLSYSRIVEQDFPRRSEVSIRKIQTFAPRELVGAGAHLVAANNSTLVLLGSGATGSGFAAPAPQRSLALGERRTTAIEGLSDVVASPDGTRVWAVATTGDPLVASVVELDPTTGAELRRVGLGRDARELAVSADGSTLMLGSTFDLTLTQVRVSDLSVTRTVTATQGLGIEWIEAVPGASNSFIFSVETRDGENGTIGNPVGRVQRIDNGVIAPDSVFVPWPSSAAASVSANPNELHVLSSTGNGLSLRTLGIDAQGVRALRESQLISGQARALRSSDSARMLLSDGHIVDPAGPRFVGRVEGQRLLIPAFNRIVSFTQRGVSEWNATDFSLVTTHPGVIAAGLGVTLAGNTLVAADYYAGLTFIDLS